MKNLHYVIIAIIVALCAISLFFTKSILDHTEPPNIHYDTIAILEHPPLNKRNPNYNWDVLYLAICLVETRFQDNAVNPVTGAAGLSQILPAENRFSAIHEANRIIDQVKYSDIDRKDPKKCREIFEIIQGYYNPHKYIERACGIWLLGPTRYRDNPQKAASYTREVKKYMKLIHNSLDVSYITLP